MEDFSMIDICKSLSNSVSRFLPENIFSANAEGHNWDRKLRLERFEDRRMLATFVVTQLFDEIVTSESSAVLTSGGNSGSLRQAIVDANFFQGPDLITFAPHLIGETITLGIDENGMPITFAHGTDGSLTLTESVEISGPGWNALTIDASGVANGANVFVMNLGAVQQDEDFIIRDLAITGGSSLSSGGAIEVNLDGTSTVTLEGLRVYDNFAANFGGGLSVGLRGDSEAVIRDSVFERNLVEGLLDTTVTDPAGGGIGLNITSGKVDISGVVIRENEVYQRTDADGNPGYEKNGDVAGGGIAVYGTENAQFRMRDSYIVGNQAGDLDSSPNGTALPGPNTGGGGGAIVSDFEGTADGGEYVFDTVVFAENFSYAYGGGLYSTLIDGLAATDPIERPLLVINSLLVDNLARYGGGIAVNDGDIRSAHVDVRHSTVAYNVAGWDDSEEYFGVGGGVFAWPRALSPEPITEYEATVRLDHSIVAANEIVTNGREIRVPHKYEVFGVSWGPDYATGTRVLPGGQLGDTVTIFGDYSILSNPAVLSSDEQGTVIFESGIQFGPAGLGAIRPRGGMAFIDGTVAPTVPLLLSSNAVDMGDIAYKQLAGSLPEYTFDGVTYEIATDHRGTPSIRVASPTQGSDPMARIDIGAYELQPTGPRVTNLKLSDGAGGTPYDFKQILTGSQDDHTQIDAIPVGQINQLEIEFSEDIGAANITASHLGLFGLLSGDGTQADGNVEIVLSNFSYDPNSKTASWDVSGIVVDEHYLILLKDDVTNPAGQALDGEWVNPKDFGSDSASQPVSDFASVGSGDGMPGGDFAFVFTTIRLFGDADNDGAVAGSDLLAVTNGFGNTGPADGFLLGDADDDGAVAGSDLLAVTNNFGASLADIALLLDIDKNGRITQNDFDLYDFEPSLRDVNGDGNIDSADDDLRDAYEAFYDDYFPQVGDEWEVVLV